MVAPSHIRSTKIHAVRIRRAGIGISIRGKYAVLQVQHHMLHPFPNDVPRYTGLSEFRDVNIDNVQELVAVSNFLAALTSAAHN